MDRDDAFAPVIGKPAIGGEKVGRGRLRGLGKHLRALELLVELRRLQVDPIEERLVREQDFERHHRHIERREFDRRQITSAVSDDAYAPHLPALLLVRSTRRT